MPRSCAHVGFRQFDKAPGVVEMLMQASVQSGAVISQPLVDLLGCQMLLLCASSRLVYVAYRPTIGVQPAAYRSWNMSRKLDGWSCLVRAVSWDVHLWSSVSLSSTPLPTTPSAPRRQDGLTCEGHLRGPDTNTRVLSVCCSSTPRPIFRTLRGRCCLLGDDRATSTASRDIREAGRPRNRPIKFLLCFKQPLPETSGDTSTHTGMQSLIGEANASSASSGARQGNGGQHDCLNILADIFRQLLLVERLQHLQATFTNTPPCSLHPYR